MSRAPGLLKRVSRKEEVIFTLLHVALSVTQIRDMEISSDTKCYVTNQFAKSPRTDGMTQIKSYKHLGP